jgi:hypothetical protein
MAAARCRVSFEDTDGITHSSHVQAESVYEAVALAVAQFRDDPMVPHPAPATEFTVSIERPSVEHRIRLSQITKWAENTTREGSAGITKREKVKTLLGQLAR